MREGKDRGGKWLIEHYGDALLHLAGIRGFKSWRAIQPQVVQQGRTPDGLLEVVFPGEKEADFFLLEIYAYPSNKISDDVLRDVMLVYLDRKSLPDVITLILHPKGKVNISGVLEKQSRLALTSVLCRWRVINMWEMEAADLLAKNEVGLIPWIPLSHFQGEPDVLLQQCRDRIEKQAPALEWENLLAITKFMASMRYDMQKFSSLLGGKVMLDEILMETPLMRQIFAEKAVEILQTDTLDVLGARFGDIPENVSAHLRTVKKEKKLKNLLRLAATCASIDAFQKHMVAR